MKCITKNYELQDLMKIQKKESGAERWNLALETDFIKPKATEDFTDKKERNIKYHEQLKKLSTETMEDIKITEKTIERIETCGQIMSFLADRQLERHKLIYSQNCRNRFCPRCSWLLSRKHSIRLVASMNYLREAEDKEFILLTLTVPNVSGNELENKIKEMNKSFKKLFERKEVKKIAKGVLRKLEVTYNAEREDYHPHFHTLIIVNKSYFDDKTYIKRDRWLELWQDCMKDARITQVDVRKVKDIHDDGLLEMAKYSVKDTDYLSYGDEVFCTFYKALKGKRLLTPSGKMKEVFEKYENKELDDYMPDKDIEYVYKVIGTWKGAKYAWGVEKLEKDEENGNEIND